MIGCREAGEGCPEMADGTGVDGTGADERVRDGGSESDTVSWDQLCKPGEVSS
jgi:hypothetical protein